ncbi:hypothetical protein HPP92_019470 [Vanilla planifolia]|uniref:Uncharacterized protein n=1 Tax=Vanilla planifolia TaxID=51239 RepID=A0A835PZH3_VANPL|nr:hypothetical protein HPP92_019470 [Vanilla planifolia]
MMFVSGFNKLHDFRNALADGLPQPCGTVLIEQLLGVPPLEDNLDSASLTSPSPNMAKEKNFYGGLLNHHLLCMRLECLAS